MKAANQIVLALSLALGACSFSQTIAEHAIDYNKSVAQSRDSQLLLNILRARDRQPMHFTALSSFTGNLTLASSAGLGVEIPIGGDAARNYIFNPEFNVSQESQPTFGVTVLENSPQFINAILTPLDLSIIRYFKNQGWPMEVLLYLLVESAEVRLLAEDGSPVVDEEGVSMFSFSGLGIEECGGFDRAVIRNNPGGKRDSECFRGIVDFLVERLGDGRERLKLVAQVNRSPVGPVLDQWVGKNADVLLQVREKGFTFIEKEGGYQLCETSTTLKFCIGPCREERIVVDKCKTPDGKRKTADEPTEESEERNGGEDDIAYGDSLPREDELPTRRSGMEEIVVQREDLSRDLREKFDSGQKLQFRAHVRSLQGMLYYAGELLRDDNEGDVRVSASRSRSECPGAFSGNAADQEAPDDVKVDVRIPILEVGKGAPLTKTVVSVSHGGEEHWIPHADDCSRTLLTLNFLNQVWGLYQSRSAVPTAQPLISIER